MTPGYVNGVRIQWPEPHRAEQEQEPEPSRMGRPGIKPGEPCRYGHPYDRMPSGKCRACNRDAWHRHYGANREEVREREKNRLAAKRAKK